MKIKSAYKNTQKEFEIILGILSGSGLIFILTSLVALLNIILPISKLYSFLIYTLLFVSSFSIIFILSPEKGKLRIYFLISSWVLFATQLYVKIFGPIL